MKIYIFNKFDYQRKFSATVRAKTPSKLNQIGKLCRYWHFKMPNISNPCRNGSLHRRLQHDAVIVCRGFTWVGFVRVVGDSAFDDVVKLQSTHAHGGQAAGQAQTGIHGLDGVAYGLRRLGA
jgi:hypothetical protein